MPLICCINIILLTNNNCNNVHLAVTSSNILDQWSPTFWARRPKTNSPLAWRASRRGLQNRGLFSSQQSSRPGGGGSVGDFEVPGTVNSFFSFLYTTRDRGEEGGGAVNISRKVFLDPHARRPTHCIQSTGGPNESQLILSLFFNVSLFHD